MASLLIKNIRQLVNTRSHSHLLRGTELAVLPGIENAYLLVEQDSIAAYGPMSELEGTGVYAHSQVVDASGQFVLPSWCDSHTHLVFAGSREGEFVDKIKGLSYTEINARGGGILHSAARLNEMSEAELFDLAHKRLQELILLGTGAIEIKSGYGLSVEGELKMLRVIKRLKETSPALIKASFLAAHTYPPAYRDNHQGYIDLIIREMLPVIAREKLADYIDVFCEKGFFSPEEMETICRAGMEVGLRPKLHVNQLNSIGGIEAGIRLDAVSLDHLETLRPEEILLLAQQRGAASLPSSREPRSGSSREGDGDDAGNGDGDKGRGRDDDGDRDKDRDRDDDGDRDARTGWEGVCTLLPTAAFFLRMPFQPARQLIDAGCAVALASDYNPGSSPSGNMNLVVSMSCIQMKMLPEEAINAATINGAYAMGLGEEAGSITVGKKANLIFTRPIPSLAYLPYAFGAPHIDKVMLAGKFIG